MTISKLKPKASQWLGVDDAEIMAETKQASKDEWFGVDDADFSWLDSLQPHSNIKELQVSEYSSATLPGWMSDPSSLHSIQEISLDFIENIESLQFSNLHTLKHLKIMACDSIRVLELEQLPSQLEELEISFCNNLEFITGLGNLDKLTTLRIYYCYDLKSITMHGQQLEEPTEPLIDRQSIPSLTKLEICKCYLLSLPNGLIPSTEWLDSISGWSSPDINGLIP